VSNKLFGQVVLLIVIANLMYLGVCQVLNWQARQRYDEALQEVREQSAASLETQQKADELEQQATAATEAAVEAAAVHPKSNAAPTWYEADGSSNPDTLSEGEADATGDGL